MSATKKPKLAKTKITVVRAPDDDPIMAALLKVDAEIKETLAGPGREKWLSNYPNLLSEECGSGLKISFDGILGEFTSGLGGSFTFAKRVAMAYAVATRTKSTWTGIGCADLTKAFEVLAYDPVKKHITVKLTEEAKQHSMEFATADLSFLNQPRPSVAAVFGYGDYPPRRRSDDW